MASRIHGGRGVNPEDWERAQELFLTLLEQPAERRDELARDLCAGNAPLLHEVERLLAGHAVRDGLLRTTGGETRAADLRAPELPLPYAVGSYRLLEQIGAGGMGTVYRAERADGQFQKQVAVKLIAADALTPRAVRRFCDERQILARLEHPSIARLLDGGTTADDRQYIVMEYVDGLPIDRYCRERRLGVRQVVELFAKVCGAVEYAHRSGVVHRDIKPANVLVTPEGTPKLLDFGISKPLGEASEANGSGTEDRTRALTPDYASPEQLLGGAVTPASDVYSLGVLLYELLCGRRAGLGLEPPPPSVVAKEVGGPPIARDLDAVVLKAVGREATSRYGSAGAFGEDLERYLRSVPVVARPRAILPRMAKFVARRRWQMVAMLAVTVFITVGTLFARYQERRMSERRLESVKALQSLFFNTDQRMAQLPQSADTRRFVFQQVSERLAGLENDARNDAEALYQIALCYAQLGWMQGWTTTAVGDFPGAAQSFRRARPLVARAVRLSGKIRDKVLMVHVVEGASGVAIWNNEFAAAEAFAAEGLSFVDRNRGEFHTAGQEEFVTTEQILLESLRAQSLSSLNRIEDARSELVKADSLIVKYSRERQPGPRLLMVMSNTEFDLAESYCLSGIPNLGIPHAETSRALATQYARLVKDNGVAVRTPMLALGVCYLSANRNLEALHLFFTLRDLYAHDAERDPRDFRVRLSLSNFHQLSGTALLKLGRLSEATHSYEEALKQIQAPPELANGSMARNYFARIYAGLGHVERRRATASRRGSLSFQEHAKASCDFYQRAESIFRERLNAGAIFQEGRIAMAAVEKELPLCSAAAESVNAR